MEYGKFNSAEELLKGYNELEKSFTQKCQQLSELRGKLSDNSDSGVNPNSTSQLPTADDGTNGNPSPSVQQPERSGAAAEENIDNAVPADSQAPSAVAESQALEQLTVEQIRQYLDAHPECRSKLLETSTEQPRTLPRVINGGGNVPLIPPTRPKTIKEASLLAKELFGGV